MTPKPQLKSLPALKDEVRDLAWFRYTLRKFLRFSEDAARLCGVTPQQHQLMLGVAGYTGMGWATLSELAEFLQERHNSVVGLVERAAQHGLVRKTEGLDDRRFVVVSLTRRGEDILQKLTQLHKQEVQRVQEGILGLPAAKLSLRIMPEPMKLSDKKQPRSINKLLKKKER